MHETRKAYEKAPSIQESNYPVGAVIVALCAVGILKSFESVANAVMSLDRTISQIMEQRGL